MDLAAIKFIDQVVNSVLTKCKPQMSNFIKSFMQTLHTSVAARESITTFNLLGSTVDVRCRKDAGHLNLAQACRAMLSCQKAVDAAKLSLASFATSKGYEESYAMWTKLDLGHALQFIDFNALIQPIGHLCTGHASTVARAIQDLKEVSQGFENGGENDWKSKIEEEKKSELKHVLEIGGTTIGNMNGKLLGEKIKAAEEAFGIWGSVAEHC